MCLDITHTEWLETYLCSKLSPPKNTYIQFYTISECLPTVCYIFSFSDVFHSHCPTDGVFTVKNPRPCYSAIHSQQKNTRLFSWDLFFGSRLRPPYKIPQKDTKSGWWRGSTAPTKMWVRHVLFCPPPRKKSWVPGKVLASPAAEQEVETERPSAFWCFSFF